jgi:hypothetical protein
MSEESIESSEISTTNSKNEVNSKNENSVQLDINLRFMSNFKNEINFSFNKEEDLFNQEENSIINNDINYDTFLNEYPFYNDILDNINTKQLVEKKKNIFNVIYPNKIALFTKTEIELPEILIGRKRKSERKRRKYNQDNIRKKIKRGFLSILIDKLNKILASIGISLYFVKLPQSFVSDVVRKTNKEILNLKLEEIFKKEELYKLDKDEDLIKYRHNLDVVNDEEIQGNAEIKNILNKKYYEIYEDYINSKEFKVDEINRLKKNNSEEADDEYIKKYIFLAQHFLEFFEI